MTWGRKGDDFGVIHSTGFVPVAGADKIWDFNDQDVTYARKDKKIGFIDTKGSWIIEAKFDKPVQFLNAAVPNGKGVLFHNSGAVPVNAFATVDIL